MAKLGDKKLVIVLILVFLVALGVIGALCYYRWNDNRKVQQDIEALKQKIAQEETRKALITELKQRKSERIESINQLTNILPSETEASHQEFLRLLRDFAEKSGVVVRTLLPPLERADRELRIKRYLYNILLDGTFPQFVRFLNQIETHTRFLKVDYFELANESLSADYWPDEKGMKKIKLQLTTYTYNPIE